MFPLLVRERPQVSLPLARLFASSYVITAEHEAECRATYTVRVWLKQLNAHRVIKPPKTTKPPVPSHLETRKLIWISAAPGCLKLQIFQPCAAYSPTPLVRFQAVATISPIKKSEVVSTALELITPVQQSGLKVSFPFCHLRASIPKTYTRVI